MEEGKVGRGKLDGIGKDGGLEERKKGLEGWKVGKLDFIVDPKNKFTLVA